MNPLARSKPSDAKAPPAERLRPLLAPGLLFLILISLTVILRDISRHLIEQDVKQASSQESQKVVSLLAAYLNERMTALKQIANFLGHSPNPDAQAFEGFSRGVMRDVPGITAIIAADADARARWVVSDDALTLEDGQNLVGAEEVAKAVEAAKAKDYVISSSMHFARLGDTGFAAVVPYYPGGARETAAGYVIGIFLNERLTQNLFLPELAGDFRVQVHQWNKSIEGPAYQRSISPFDPKAEEASAGVAQLIVLGSQIWQITVEPSGYHGYSPSYFTGGTILTLGTILSVLISLMLYRQQVVAARSRSEAMDSRSRLASTSDRLGEVREQLDLILNNVDEEIVLYDEEMAPLRANARFRKAFPESEADEGYPAEAHHRAMAGRFHNPAQYWALVNTIRENPERPFSDEIEASREEGGPPRFYRRHATAVCGPDGSRRGYLVVYHDVTPARVVEKLKEDFLSSVTHDLRTPLTAIEGFAETMLRDPAMAEKTREEFTSIIRSESARLREMIEDLLDLRRMEEGRVDLSPATYRLRPLIEDVVRSSAPVLESRDIEVKIEWAGLPARPLFGDSGKIGRALGNVLSNSIKYSPMGSRIWIRGLEEEDRVEISFTDEGPGIPVDDLPHVFEKFYRGSRHVRRTAGTGLGLAIVRHIVESHGGVVTAANAPGRGAVIKIVLPRELELGLEAVTPVRGAEKTAEPPAGANAA